MSEVSLVSYDQVPYHSGPFRQTHPSHLAVLPILFGMTPPTVRGARVLELGCASGGNLMPMAQCFPDAQFVGVDLSARQIDDGRRVVEKLGLHNIHLRHASILDVDESYGKFDFVLCHGVYSWVPRPVQDRILEICSRNLTEHGVCYVSYNVYPGWHFRGVVRDMMRYHVANFEDPQTKIDQARSLLDFLNRSASTAGNAYRQVLADEAQIIARHSDSYLYHEHLEEVNEPLYFHEFVERASAAQLLYLGDSNFSTMLTDRLDPEAAAILRNATLTRQEQYMDFLRNRTFRCSVLCHKRRPVDRTVQGARLASCSLALDTTLELPKTSAEGPETWEITLGRDKISAAQPVTKVALEILNQVWPSFVPAATLLERIQQRLPATRIADASSAVADDARSERSVLFADLLTLFARGLLQAWLDPPQIAAQVSDRPRASPLARLQAERGDATTNQRHESIRLADLPRAMLSVLDGTRDRKALCQWLAEALGRGAFRVLRDDQPVSDVDEKTQMQIVDATLNALRVHALLVE